LSRSSSTALRVVDGGGYISRHYAREGKVGRVSQVARKKKAKGGSLMAPVSAESQFTGPAPRYSVNAEKERSTRMIDDMRMLSHARSRDLKSDDNFISSANWCLDRRDHCSG
jgi:hypothetical protein